MFNLPDLALGAVIAAVVTAFVSWLGLIITKEQKISDFRQAWIDALRVEISAVVAHANAIHGAAAAQLRSPAELWSVAREDYVKLNQAEASIRLRLNPNEKESLTVLSSIEKLEEHLTRGYLDHREINQIEKQLVVDAQALLKKEWGRVRVGEPMFLWSKRLLLFFVGVGIVVAIGSFVTKTGLP